MSTLAKVQAESLSDEVKREVISQWFADNWLLVAENDRDSYEQLNASAEEAKTADTLSPLVYLSDELRLGWESITEDATELIAEHLSPTAALFISQILQGWGTLPFDLIAKQVLDNQ